MKFSCVFFALIAFAAAAAEAGSIHGISNHRVHRDGLGKKELRKRCAHSRKKSKLVSPKNDVSLVPSQGEANDLITEVDSCCGPSGATENTTPTSGPNGSIDWLNFGVEHTGWHPPHVSVDDIISKDLASAIKEPGSPFKACSGSVGLFYKYGAQYKLPPILLASISLQESSCNPGTVGGAGEQGLMQITKDKCGGAPGGDCKNPDFNVGAGTKFLANTLATNGGNLLKAIGIYNGWEEGMTVGQATAAAHTSCCRCQNNLDYLHQVLNGWILNKNPNNPHHRLGKYFNLDIC